MANGCCLRGQRVWCANRGARGGCGRSYSVFIADVLPGHTFRASWLWQWLLKWLAGHSLKAAAEQCSLPFALETVYRLRQKLRRTLDELPTRLCSQQQPPGSTQAEPLLQTLTHLRVVFATSPCPPAEFQLHFQRPFLG